MNSIQSRTHFFSLLPFYVKTASLLAIGVGLIVLIGWSVEITLLKSILPDAAVVKFNTALSFVLAGLSLWLVREQAAPQIKRRIGQTLASLALLMGLLTLSEYLFQWDLGIDQLFAKDSDTLSSPYPGRMSEISAICFILIGLAILVIHSRISEYLSLAVTLLALLVLIGYLFDFESLYRFERYGLVPLPTAIVLFIFSLGLLAARPHRGMMKIFIADMPGSRMMRRYLPELVLLTITLGWLVERGERLGLFTVSSDTVILVILFILVYAPLVYLNAQSINQVEAELKHKDKLLRMTSEMAKVGGWEYDTETLKGAWTDEVARIHELDPEQDPNVELGLSFFQGESRAKIENAVWEANEEGKPYDLELEMLTARGNHKWVRTMAIPILRDEKVVKVQGIFQDITERKQAEEELKKNERILRLFVEHSPAAVAMFDKEMNYIIASHRYLMDFEMDGQDLTGRSHYDVFPELPERWKKVHQRCLQGAIEKKEEDTFLRADGTLEWERWEIHPWYEAAGKIGGIILFAELITERKRAKEEIQRQLERLNSLREIDIAINSSLDMRVSLEIVLQQVASQLKVDAAAILLLDPDQQTMAYISTMGFRSAVTHRKPVKLGKGYGSQVVQMRRTIYVPDLNHIQGEPASEFPFLKEGFVEYYGLPLIVKGEIKGVLEIYHRTRLRSTRDWLDFMETLAGQAAIAIDNAQLWEQTQRHARELEQRVEERTTELNRTNLELEHANRAKDAFLANMSHELRTPLNSILGLSESLLEQARNSLSDRQQRSLQVIESSGRHLLALINDILDLSKIEAGKLDYYPEMVEITDICQASLSFVKSQALKKSINLSYEGDKTVTKIYADPRRLKQILVNLLTNAVKFTPERGQVTLQVRANADENLIQFSVIDTGVGIAPADLEKLFQPFVQVDSKLTRQVEGTGLGLALVQKLTDAHGGSVQVESEVGKGSRFTINLPWVKDKVTQPESLKELSKRPTPVALEEPVAPSAPTTTHKRILLVEDNRANILTIGEYLESYEYQVIVAHDGVEAIKKAQEINPDIILMDVQMPAMDGLEAMRLLRADPRFATTPVIALTALAMPGDRERCLKAGASEYMSKPVGLKKLLHIIQELLGQEG